MHAASLAEAYQVESHQGPRRTRDTEKKEKTPNREDNHGTDTGSWTQEIACRGYNLSVSSFTRGQNSAAAPHTPTSASPSSRTATFSKGRGCSDIRRFDGASLLFLPFLSFIALASSSHTTTFSATTNPLDESPPPSPTPTPQLTQTKPAPLRPSCLRIPRPSSAPNAPGPAAQSNTTSSRASSPRSRSPRTEISASGWGCVQVSALRRPAGTGEGECECECECRVGEKEP
ncbi:hypothetical protein D9615_009829 [Tricholomella constricta]|uniref:Uncharacterized protein n=1 Tax=Tricholomella constricta TaxID=117010 RepID=A0A8H5GWM6_9AGAR|nr:hypothetical protein D9615_009829 [Tricholomella constricta]